MRRTLLVILTILAVGCGGDGPATPPQGVGPAKQARGDGAADAPAKGRDRKVPKRDRETAMQQQTIADVIIGNTIGRNDNRIEGLRQEIGEAEEGPVRDKLQSRVDTLAAENEFYRLVIDRGGAVMKASLALSMVEAVIAKMTYEVTHRRSYAKDEPLTEEQVAPKVEMLEKMRVRKVRLKEAGGDDFGF